MSRILTTYDGPQHCAATREPHGESVAMDCPYTGKGEELSPTNLVEAALGGCMLLSMGNLAMRNNIDIKGTKIRSGPKILMDAPPAPASGSLH